MSEISVVIATRDRRRELLQTLGRLATLDDAPPVVVVDNASSDGTPEAVRAAHPRATVVALHRNLGAAARTIGARRTATPYVAFCDDDSWWAPGALERARRHFASTPWMALLAGRILVGPEERLDPTCAAMAASPLPDGDDLPGPPILGFLACAAVVRRDAFLAVGGFSQRLVIGGEESLLALDLAAAGWSLAYAADVVAHHHPTRVRRPDRDALLVRNALLVTWLRRPAPVAVAATARALRQGQAPAVAAAARALPWVLRERRVVPAGVEAAARLLERTRN
jgi:N-acetylglucosaminyl-diphospho-decaprenol L-rhamnosyltransferase